MKAIRSWRRQRYVAGVSILLLTASLIAGAVSCEREDGPVHYDLTVASTIGGSVTIPGEGTFTYEEGAIVNLVAEAEEGYCFIDWTGDTDTVANVSVAMTTIIMNADYSVAATFREEEEYEYRPMVAAGDGYTVGVKSDGTVIAGVHQDGGPAGELEEMTIAPSNINRRVPQVVPIGNFGNHKRCLGRGGLIAGHISGDHPEIILARLDVY